MNQVRVDAMREAMYASTACLASFRPTPVCLRWSLMASIFLLRSAARDFNSSERPAVQRVLWSPRLGLSFGL